jgi:hypothetical protein
MMPSTNFQQPLAPVELAQLAGLRPLHLPLKPTTTVELGC